MKPSKSNHSEPQHDKPTKPTKLVLQQLIIEGVYSFDENLFRSKNRFEMVLSQPNPKFKFQVVKEIFKGRYICKNPSCMEHDEFSKTNPNQSDSSDDSGGDQPKNRQFKTWSSWHQSQPKRFTPKVNNQYETLMTSSDQQVEKVAEKSQNDKSQKANLNPVKKQNRDKTETKAEKQTENEKKQIVQNQNKKWSSSMSQVYLYYQSCPQPLEKLKELYEKKRNQKIQIFFYVELTGQICRKCDNETYCYPFFSKGQLKRIKKNFSNFFYNKINNNEILRYRPCPLRKLYIHDKARCEACHRGLCQSVPSLSG